MGLLTFDQSKNLYIYNCLSHEWEVPRAAGFKRIIDNEGKILWVTHETHKALSFFESAGPSAEKRLHSKTGLRHVSEEVLKLSPRYDELLRCQREGVLFSLSRDHSFYAGSPGIGKSAVAITTFCIESDPRFSCNGNRTASEISSERDSYRDSRGDRETTRANKTGDPVRDRSMDLLEARARKRQRADATVSSMGRQAGLRRDLSSHSDSGRESFNYEVTRRDEATCGGRRYQNPTETVFKEQLRVPESLGSNFREQSYKGQCLIICMPSLVLNWEEQINLWGWGDLSTELVTEGSHELRLDSRFTIVADSLLTNEYLFKALTGRFKKTGERFLRIIVDEAQRYKTPNVGRTKALYRRSFRSTHGDGRPRAGLISLGERSGLLSGTPMLSRPLELWPLVSRFARHLTGIHDRHSFGVRYCGGFETPFGWDYKGASNVGELSERLKPYMLRHDKFDELDLPPRLIRTIKLPKKPSQKYLRTYEDLKELQDDEFLEAMRFLPGVAELVKEGGLAKEKASHEYIEAALEQEDQIILFAWHNEVIDNLAAWLKKKKIPTAIIRGGVSSTERQKIEKAFMKAGSKLRVVIMQIKTAVGITMTAARRAIFVEMSDVPGDNEQAMDRIHRIGQKRKCLIDLLLLQHDIGERQVVRLKNKLKVLNQFYKPTNEENYYGSVNTRNRKSKKSEDHDTFAAV